MSSVLFALAMPAALVLIATMRLHRERRIVLRVNERVENARFADD